MVESLASGKQHTVPMCRSANVCMCIATLSLSISLSALCEQSSVLLLLLYFDGEACDGFYEVVVTSAAVRTLVLLGKL